MTGANKPRLIGINHVAIEVGNIDEALEWYGRIFDFALRGKGERNAFIDMGDPVRQHDPGARLCDQRRREAASRLCRRRPQPRH
jgi:catechol 2,3-dioxygenase-like lactoylglutathione lyase family enzyme